MTSVLPEQDLRHEHGRLVSILSRRFGAQSIELCEDAAQAALLRAVETWTRAGVPDEPGGWLLCGFSREEIALRLFQSPVGRDLERALPSSW